MRRLLAAILGCLLVLVVPGVSAFADSPTYNTRITVYATILPHRYVIVDSHNTILEIDSNTSENVVPEEFVDSLAANHKQPLSDTVYKQYQQLLAAKPGPKGVGVLYKRPQGQYLLVSKLMGGSSRYSLTTR